MTLQVWKFHDTETRIQRISVKLGSLILLAKRISHKARKGSNQKTAEGKRYLNGDGRRQLWVVNTQYNTQMLYYRIVHLKPI